MGFSYLTGKRWADITREERFFCAELYHAIRGREKVFLEHLNDRLAENATRLTLAELEADWETAFEVCFFRDVLHARGLSVKDPQYPDYSPKRTFDLCLFSERVIAVIEAKAAMGFEQKQLQDVQEDARRIGELLSQLKVPGTLPRVLMVGLVSSRYSPKATTADAFHGLIRWNELSELFPGVKALSRANAVFGEKVRPITGDGLAPGKLK